jgi:peptide/nickel transport system substrate-binding protein
MPPSDGLQTRRNDRKNRAATVPELDPAKTGQWEARMGGQTRIDASDRGRAENMRGRTSSDLTRRGLLTLSALGIAAAGQRAALAASPDGQLTWAVHISLAPTWFDPAETPGMITPFLLMYALHDAMVKPMPGSAAEPCLA